jgi:Ohr subfamily peroxiredoxin
MVKQLQKRVYTATVTSTGGRDGHSKSADGAVNFKMGKPVEMGGKNDGLNPEQLFAAGYSACFLGALKFVAGQDKITVSDDASITAAVTFGPIDHGFGLAVELTASDLPLFKRDTWQHRSYPDGCVNMKIAAFGLLLSLIAAPALANDDVLMYETYDTLALSNTDGITVQHRFLLSGDYAGYAIDNGKRDDATGTYEHREGVCEGPNAEPGNLLIRYDNTINCCLRVEQASDKLHVMFVSSSHEKDGEFGTCRTHVLRPNVTAGTAQQQ